MRRWRPLCKVRINFFLVLVQCNFLLVRLKFGFWRLLRLYPRLLQQCKWGQRLKRNFFWLLQGLKLKKQRSTGDLDRKGVTSIRSTGSSTSWMSSESGFTTGASMMSEGSNQSFVLEVRPFILTLHSVRCSPVSSTWLLISQSFGAKVQSMIEKTLIKSEEPGGNPTLCNVKTFSNVSNDDRMSIEHCRMNNWTLAWRKRTWVNGRMTSGVASASQNDPMVSSMKASGTTIANTVMGWPRTVVSERKANTKTMS